MAETLARHPILERWQYTDEVVVDETVVSHSHPVLTIGTKSSTVQTEAGLISVYLHEQMHWFLSAQVGNLTLILESLRAEYPHVKVGVKEGAARDEGSTYLHLVVCALELRALSEVVGRSRAERIVLSKPYYRWIYRKVVSNQATINAILERHGLVQIIHTD